MTWVIYENIMKGSIGMNEKYLKKLVEVMKKSKVDAMLIAPSEELEFILGHTTFLCERFQALVINNSGDYFYICNMLTYNEMSAVLNKKHKIYGWYDGTGYIDVVKKAFEENDLIGKTIGVNSTERAFIILDMQQRLNVKFINGRPLLEQMRIIKTPDEIENMKIACRITDQTFNSIINYVKPGMSEGDIIEFIKNEFTKRGANFGFAIIASGQNSSFPHYNECSRIIEKTDVLLLDFGCIYKGMSSDMTRTVFIGGATKEQIKTYNYVLKSEQIGIEKAVCGAYIPDIDKAARDVIDESGFGNTFVTRLGHGIGYTMHEAPDIKQSNKMYLEPGMIFSIEPGIYRANEFGVRIEDLVLCTPAGNEILSHSNRDLIIIK